MSPGVMGPGVMGPGVRVSGSGYPALLFVNHFAGHSAVDDHVGAIDEVVAFGG